MDRQRSRKATFDARVKIVGTSEWAAHSSDAIGVKEVAAMIGRGQTYVKTHAEELGGIKFTEMKGLIPGASRWLFSRAKVRLTDEAIEGVSS